MRPTLRVLVVDANASLGAVLAELFDDEADFRSVGSATSVEQALGRVGAGLPDVVMVDERLNQPGADALSRLRQACPEALLVVWSHDAARTAVEDADGVVLRGATFREVVSAVRALVRARRQSVA